MKKYSSAFIGIRRNLRSLKTAWTANRHKRHLIRPNDSKLAQKLGIIKGEKILFVAGFSGEWANSLAQTCEVRFTDAGKGMVGTAKRKYKNKMKYTKAYAQLLPQRPLIYSWTVSFEPFPVANAKGNILSSIRSLLNKKGSKIIFSDPRNSKHTQITFENIAKSYSCKAELAEISIQLDTQHMHPLTVNTLVTNKIARQRAINDLKIIRVAEKFGREKLTDIEIKEIAKKTNLTEATVRSSIKRVNTLIAADNKWLIENNTNI